MTSTGHPRWRIDLGYDGTDFHGWAEQPGLRTVQGVLQDWLTRLLGGPVQLVVAGRTDAGVHARAQVAHLDPPAGARFSPADLTRALAQVLPSDLVVHRVSPAAPGFDARFAATWRRYCYRLWDADSVPDPLRRREVHRVAAELDLAAMNRAGETLLGLRDFAPFCRARKDRAGTPLPATTIRDLQVLRASRSTDHCRTVELEVVADAFCHSMVRSLAGALTEVGSGHRSADWLAGVAAGSRRAGSVPVLPAGGLTLEEVGYPAEQDFAARVDQARSRRSMPNQEAT